MFEHYVDRPCSEDESLAQKDNLTSCQLPLPVFVGSFSTAAANQDETSKSAFFGNKRRGFFCVLRALHTDRARRPPHPHPHPAHLKDSEPHPSKSGSLAWTGSASLSLFSMNWCVVIISLLLNVQLSELQMSATPN